MVVEKRGNKWCTIHCHGADKGKVISCFDTKEAAMAQHRAIEASKHVKKIEINLGELSKIRGTHSGWIDVKRGSKTFKRWQRIGTKTTSITQDISKPNPEIIEVLEAAHKYSIDMAFGKPEGVVEFDVDSGDFTFQPGDYNDWSTGESVPTKPDPVKFRVEGNNIRRLNDGFCITVPEKEIDNPNAYEKLLHYLDDKWGRRGSTHKIFKQDHSEYENNIKKLDEFVPEYEDVFEEGSGKYSKNMDLKTCSNTPITTDHFVPILWYGGNHDDTALVGEATQSVFTGNYDENNVIQQQIPLMIEGAKKINAKYGTDVIYRGETNINSARDILLQIDEFGDAELADKLFSCTENEKLGKWYAATHDQLTAQGTRNKTNVMLRIPREKFADNVIMDHRLTESAFNPEEEVTIVGNDISLTGDDVMINAITPKCKNKKWMSFTQFKSEGGITEDFVNQIR